VGSLNRKLQRILAEKEGEVERYLMPDGQVWSFPPEAMGLAFFAAGVNATCGTVDENPTREMLAAVFGVRVDGGGRPLDREAYEYQKSGEWRSEGGTLLYPGFYGVKDYRKGECDPPEIPKWDEFEGEEEWPRC